ncbi:MAG TPA: T9SS type B sorting domain-containing protein, partial [Cyclobacteriaceae bacterium]
LTWVTSSSGISNFSLSTNGATQALPNTPFSYADKNVICNTPYTYQLTANYSTATSVSLPKTVTSILVYTPGKINYIGSEVNAEGNSVKLTWAPGVNPKEYQIFKTTNSVAIGKTTTEDFTDGSFSTNVCYKIRYEDNCDNMSDMSDEFCPIHLSSTLNKDNSALLSWAPYPGVTIYTIEKYNVDGQLIQTITGITAITYTEPSPVPGDDQVYQYKVIAEQNPTLLTTSNVVKVIKQPNIYYPRAFTPNNDNLNDSFEVIGQFVTAFEMKIFNRWGEMMFSTDNINEGWDGKYHGLAMPEGTYAFTAILTDEMGRKFNRSGSVVLLHKN